MKSEKVGRFPNGRFIDNFDANKTGRQCVGCNKDNNWFVYIDRIVLKKTRYGSVFSDCFLWNPSLQVQVRLPRISGHTSQAFFKCLVNDCSIDTTTSFCCYTVSLHYKNKASYIWCTQDSYDWNHAAWITTDDPGDSILSDVVPYHHSEYVPDTYCGITTAGTLFIRKLGLVVPPLPNFLGNRQRRLVVCYGKDDGREDDRLLLLERTLQCPWEVWEFDCSSWTWVSLSSLEGLVVFLGRNYSAAYEHTPIENCICFTEDGDDEYFYVYSLADQTMSIFRNRPHSGFPAWFPNLTEEDLTMPWLNFIEEDEHRNANTDYEIRPLDPDQECFAHESLYCQLPDDLQRIIAESLPSTSAMDYANYRLVCRHWREIARPIRWKSGYSNAPSTECPWLMSFDEKDSCTSFVDPSCNMIYFNSNPELSGCKVRESRNGWLLVTRGLSTVFFLEPLSKTIIFTPDLPEHAKVDFMSFSSSPTSLDCIIFAVLPMHKGIFYLMYLRPTDNEWNVRWCGAGDFPFMSYGCNLVCHDNNFYYLCQNGSLVLYEPETFMLRVSKHRPFELLSNNRKGHLVSCKHKLYLVVTGPLGKSVNLYKLELEPTGFSWKEVKVLPTGFSFFISQTSSFAVRVTQKAHQNTINLPLFVENRHVYYKLDKLEFRCYGDNNSSVGLHERKELHSLASTWLQPKVTRKYS